MTFLQDGYFQIGDVEFPLTASLSNPLLQDADPGLFAAMAFYQGVFSLHLMPRWQTEITRAGMQELDGYLPSEVLPYDPFRKGLGALNAFRFPLMAIYPIGTTYDWKTMTWYDLTRDLELLFVLPPLSSEQFEYLHPFLSLAEKVIMDRTMQGLDSNVQAGKLFWHDAGIEKITLTKSLYGNIAERTDLQFPALTISLSITERQEPVTSQFATLHDIYNEVDGYAPADPFNVADGYVTF